MAKLKRRGPSRVRKEEPYKVNDKITVHEVRVIGENVKMGIYPIGQALKIAEEQDLDLVEISPNAEPPVCKIIDYSKFKYEQKKKQKEIKGKTQKTIIKEIRFGPNTEDHDFNFKLNHAIKFLKEGAKVKAYVQFYGRTIVYKSRGEILLLRFAQALEEYGKVEQLPKMEGKRMILYMNAKQSRK